MYRVGRDGMSYYLSPPRSVVGFNTVEQLPVLEFSEQEVITNLQLSQPSPVLGLTAPLGSTKQQSRSIAELQRVPICESSLLDLQVIDDRSVLNLGENISATGIDKLMQFSHEFQSKQHVSERKSFRKYVLALCFVLLVCALVVSIIFPVAFKLRSSNLLEARLNVIRKLLSRTPLIDGHNQFVWNLRKRQGHTKLQDFPFEEDLSKNLSLRPDWQTDLSRLSQGIVGAQFWSVYVPCQAQFLDAVKLTLEQIDIARRLTYKYSKKMRLVTSSQELEQAHKDRIIGSLIGIEGGHSIGASMAVLRSFYFLGARYMTLTHKCNTPWADSAMADDPDKDIMTLGFRSDGLTSFGKAVVHELNRLGMIVDLSHVSLKTMHDALSISTAPVIFSHSAARALCNSSSNVPDEILQKLIINGGIVMISFDSAYLSCGKEASMQDVIAHINYIKKTAGIDHVGLGAGYDGMLSPPMDLPDVSGYPLLLAELTRDRKWPSSYIKKLVGGNLLRVFKEVENQARFLSNRSAAEEWIPQDVFEDSVYCRYLGV